ncbi:LysM peptidoglycan-binding domain-containing protein [Sporosarcina sp. 179-K 3D1 HS]|uniref:LysM peptidoglycan-binding domain-containing protein n=1 Tax=Sporosarcina sp. 179-K 3D1 HS TaxID=3232169 RepID=UPI00399F9A5C
MQVLYRVRPGDTVNRIAARWGISAAALIAANQLSPPYTIFIGQQLVIPLGQKGVIAYTLRRDDTYDIGIFHPQSGEQERLTNGIGDSFSHPFWSPDGNKIAFVGKGRIVYVIYLDTRLIAAIDRLEEGNTFLSWSPDNRRLAYAARGSIMLYDVTTHEANQIRQPGVTDINWFPSGVELLFQAADTKGKSQLYRIRTNGRGKQLLTQNTEGLLQNVRLSPDGSFALYTTPGVSVSIIHTVDLATGQVHRVKGGPLGKNYFPVWSPDSSKIAFSSTGFSDSAYFSQIRTVGRRGEGERVWTTSNCFSTPVSWSPDGTEIAYLSGCQLNQFATEIWSVSLNQPVPKRLLKRDVQSLQWSPTVRNAASKKTYSNELYKVQFQYPADWNEVREEKYQGPNGFFQISAVSGTSIDEVCHNEAFHGLLPYGTSPQIMKTKIQGESACFVIPSEDQPIIMEHQAALIVRYPRPVEIGGQLYQFFVLWADRDHIHEFAETLTFLG